MIKISHFGNFEKVIIKIAILLTLNKSKNLVVILVKKPNNKTPLGETGCIDISFLRPLPCVTCAPPWLLRPMRVSTSSELYPDTWLSFVFFECIGIQFFNSLTCDLRDTIPRQRSLTLTLTLIPREAEDFPRGDRHFKHAPLPTYLICLSPKGLYW